MPNTAAAFAAVRGSIAPRLFSPSVSRIITRDRPGASRSRLAAVAIAVPIAVPSSSWPGGEIVDRRVHDGIVRRQRHLRQRLGRERDDADAIARARGDESLHDVLRDLEPVLRLEVLREHRAREVDREHDVDAFARHVLGVRAGARPRQRDDRRREQQVAQHEQHQRRRAAGARARRQHGDAREHDRRRTSAPAPNDPPDRQQRAGTPAPTRDANWIAPSAIMRPPPAPPARRLRRARARRATIARASRPSSRARSVLTGRRANLMRSASVEHARQPILRHVRQLAHRALQLGARERQRRARRSARRDSRAAPRPSA